MGIILAKRDEERLDFNQSRARAAVYLEKCRPEYITDDEQLGLAPDGDDEIRLDALGDPEGLEVEDDEEDHEPDPNDPAQRAHDRMKQDHLTLLNNAAKGYKYKVMSLARIPHINLNYKDKFGRSALYLAAERGHPNVVSVLIGHRVKIMNENADGWTPLHAATFHGQIKCMDVLLEAQASINARDGHGCTPLTLAASSPKLYLMDLVSKADRKKRQIVRADAYSLEQDMESTGKKKELVGSLRMVAPELVWTYFPNRIELVVMERIFKRPRIQVDLVDTRKRTPLIYAARYGRLFAVSRLIYAKANTRVADKDGRTPLFHAAVSEHWDTVELLLRAGASVNTTDQYFRTPLHAALENGDEAMATLLLKAEASVNAYDCEGHTPIMFAMEQKNRRLFSEIVKQRSNLDVLDKRGWNVVIYAIETGMLAEVMPLLVKLADRVKPILRARDPQGRNAMHHAATLHSVAAANKAVESLVKLDQEAGTIGDCNGDTAIHMAAEFGRLDTLRLLSQNMISADFINNRGETPLHHAAHGGHLACVVALIQDRGQGPACDSGAEDIEGRTILMHAAISGHLDLVNLLLQNREGTHQELAFVPIDVNQMDKAGVTALSLAAREGHWHLLPSLALAGANLAAKDNDGFSALHWAAIEDEPLAVSCLLDLGVDPDVADARGWTALMQASVRGCDEAARVLVDGRADLDARNWDGDTAMQVCSRRKDSLIQITIDILSDASLDLDTPARMSIVAPGHFMVSVISAEDLFVEGKVEQLNTYVCLMFRTQASAAPQVAFTSCSLRNPCPRWQEVFRFDTDVLDPTACLVAWVIAAPGNSPEELVQATALGLNEEQIQQVKLQEAISGTKINKGKKPQFTTAMQQSFTRLMKRGDRNEDKDVLRMRKLALAQSKGAEPTMDLLPTKQQKESYPVEERQWIEVENLRALIGRSGCEIQEPLVPRNHLPLGCVVVRFRHLRAAVWGTEIVQVSRTLRLNSRGNLKLEVDFRPRFFAPQQVSISSQVDDEVYTIKPTNDPVQDALLTGPPIEALAEPEKIDLGVNPNRVPGFKPEKEPKNDAELLAHRFRRVYDWSGKVLDCHQQMVDELGMQGIMMDSPGADVRLHRIRREPAPEGANLLQKAVHYSKETYKVEMEKRVLRQALLDKPVGAANAATRHVLEPGEEQPVHGSPFLKLPHLEAEPFVEELMESSRLI